MSTQKYTLGKTSLSKLEGVHPSLVKVIKLAIQKTTQDFSVNEGLRSLDRQKRLVAAGASRTLNSKHLKQADGYGHASDLIPWGDFDGNGTNEISWSWEHFYPIAEAMRAAAKELNIRVRWGGCWEHSTTQQSRQPNLSPTTLLNAASQGNARLLMAHISSWQNNAS